MKSQNMVLFAVVFAAAFCCIQCSKCSSEKMTSEDTTAPGEALKNASLQEGSIPLEWEHVQLGVSRQEFKAAVAEIFQQEPARIEDLFQCGALQAILAVSPPDNALLERESGGKLTWCTISSMSVEATSRISSIRGEFYTDALVNLVFKFKPADYDALESELYRRFGKGENRNLTQETLAGSQTRALLLWKLAGGIWGLEKGDRETTLIIQDAGALNRLPVFRVTPAQDAAVKTDLSDIGIKGSPYDVNLDDLEVPADGDTAPGIAQPADSDS